MRKWNSTVRRFIKSPFDEPLGGGGGPFGGGGIPPWAVNANMWKDFTGDRARGTLPDPADTHTQVYAPNAAGVYLPFAANVLTRTDLGLQTVPTRTNLALQSNAFDVTWNKVSGTTVTANNRAAPDGTLTADQIDQDGGTANQGVNQIIATGATIASKTFSASFFVYSITAFTGTIRVRGTGATQEAENFSVSIAANQWTRVTGVKAFTGAADGTDVFFGFIGDFGLLVARSYWLWNGQYELGAFASPPITTTVASVTVNGNQQVISGLGTQLAVGVAGIVQFVLPGGPLNSSRIFEFDDGSGTNRAFGVADTAAISVQMTAAGVAQGTVVPLGIPATAGTLYTLAFSFSTDYINARLVGQAAVSADVLATWPVMDRLQIAGGDGNAVRNSYQFTKKLALKFGPQNATTFAAMYDKAVLAAAAA